MKDGLIWYLRVNRRVCPMPMQWQALYEMLPEIHRVGDGWEPSIPLILGAWGNTSDAEKRDRLMLHIDYAEEKGAIAEVDKYLRSLTEEQWLHEQE